MPTTNPVPSTDPTDLLFNAGRLDEAVNSSSGTYTDRLGITRRTLNGIDSEAETRMDAIDAAAISQRDNIQDAADLVLAAAGYAPPVAYSAGISLTLQTQTVSYNGDTYAPKQSELPFTTSGTFETAKFRLIQGVASADLALSSGASLVGYDGETVQDVLDGAKSLQDYAALRAYSGRAKRVYITGLLVTAKPAGIAGVFQFDSTDTTSADNGGTIIVGADGRRWKRDFSGPANVAWWGATFSAALDDTVAVKAAVAYVNSTGGTLSFPGICNVYEEIVVDANVARLQGTKGRFNGGLSLKAAGAKLRIGGNGTNRYLGSIEDFIVTGNNIATNLVEMKDAGEFGIDNLFLSACPGVGLKLTGDITGIMKIKCLQTSGVANPVRFEDNSNVWLDGCNFYNSDKIFTFYGVVSNIVVRDTWMETYNYVVDFDSSANVVDVFGFRFRDCHFQNTLGGAGKTSRIARSYATNNTYRNRVYGFSISGGNVYHTNSNHLVEVNWNGNTSGGLNKLQGKIDEVCNSSPAGILSWIKSDVANTDIPWIDLKYGDSNYNLVQIPVDYDVNLTGGTKKLPANTASPPVSDQAPLYVTQNSVATTITNFSGAHAGQVIRVLVRDANTTFQFAGSSTLSGNKGSDYAALNGDFLDFRYDGTMWHASIGNETKRSGTASVTLSSGGFTAITHGLGATAKMFKVSARGSTPYFITTNPANSSDTCLATFYTSAGAVAAYANVVFDWEASL